MSGNFLKLALIISLTFIRSPVLWPGFCIFSPADTSDIPLGKYIYHYQFIHNNSLRRKGRSFWAAFLLLNHKVF